MELSHTTSDEASHTTWGSVVPPVQNRSPRHSGKDGTTYHATTGENIEGDLQSVHIRETVTDTVVTSCKCSINPITNPNPVSRH
jgi:hypothetical protein